jgi:hypothetical protein
MELSAPSFISEYILTSYYTVSPFNAVVLLRWYVCYNVGFLTHGLS